MVFGSTISEVVDEPGKRLDFTAEETDGVEWQWYKDLSIEKTEIGPISNLRLRQKQSKATQQRQGGNKALVESKAGSKSSQDQSSKIMGIDEMTDETEADLPIYQKPDSDPEDDDDDPELVQRNKLTPPV